MAGNVRVTKDKLASIVDSINQLVKKQVLVGIPASEATRNDGQMDNASLGYLHERGSPAQNIPARPFLIPGVDKSQDAYMPHLEKASTSALDGKRAKVDEELEIAGMIARDAVKNELDTADFVPLAPSTLRARARRGRKGAKAELASRAAGNAPNNDNARPLTDSGQMRNAVNYVLRNK